MANKETAQSSSIKALEILRNRLLDLTSRNRLINFRHTRSGSVRIIDELPDQLVEMLLADTEMRFLPVPEPTEKELIEAGYLEIDGESGQLVRVRKDPTAKEWAGHLGFATEYEVPEKSCSTGSDKHSDSAIQTLFYPYELESRLRSLLQASESAIQEMGANILYLAFGFLEWFDVGNRESPRLAPLFLVPVRLHKGRLNRKSGIYEYILSYSGEEIIPNLSLREKLRVDFGMALPDLDENTLPEDYFNQVQKLVGDRHSNWRVRRYVSLTLLNFGKLLMYRDLDPANWPRESCITEHPVVAAFLAGCDGEKNDGFDSPGVPGFCEEYAIDDIEDIHTSYPLIEDADSSQHSALVDALDGKNLVIEGPPGTGKSQTITNLIAAAMAAGKRVLFVAEKAAALDVVRNRLDAAGLGEFCLELHSHKSQKRRVLDEIEARLKKHGRYRKPDEIEADIARYEELKTKLKKHAERINTLWRNTGKTIQEILVAATRYRVATGVNPKEIHPEGYDGGNYDASTRRRNEDQVDAYRKVYRDVARQLEGDAALQAHPWFGVKNGELQMFELEQVVDSLEAWQESLRRLISEREALCRLLGQEPTDIPVSVSGLADLAAELELLPPLVGDEVMEALPLLRGEVLEKTQRYLRQFVDIQNLYRLLVRKVPPEIVHDLSRMDEILPAGRKLKGIVRQNIRLGQLAKAVNHLSALHDQLKRLEEPLRIVADALEDSGRRHLVISRSGLAEFRSVVEVVSSLDPSGWQYRNEALDNDELDELLPLLHRDIERLKKMEKPLQQLFSLQTLPSENELRELMGTLATGGVLRWFKRDWRSARKRILSHAAHPGVRYSSMEPLLGDLVRFCTERRKFEEDERYRAALGESFQGLETDVATLESLRKWYREVRRRYGVGFGEKVALGEAVISLPQNMGRVIRSLSDRGILRHIDGILARLDQLSRVFEPVAGLRSGNVLLVGERGVLFRVLSSVKSAVQACGPLARDNSLPIGELVNRAEQLELLRKKVDVWQREDLDRTLFNGRLGLRIGAGVDNEAGLSSLQHTLDLAACIDGKLTNQFIIQYLYRNPCESAFESLATFASRIRTALSSQADAGDSFRRMVNLDPDCWAIRSGESVDGLISRNQSALDNRESLRNWLDYVRVRDQLKALGLGRLVESVESGRFDVEQIMDLYRAGIYDLLAREIFREEPQVARFSGRSQEAIQEKFREYDHRLKRLQCEHLAWKIDQALIPAGKTGGRGSELTERALLEHECSKKTRHIPIRQLLRRSGKALQALKPCFMMGPMSVSQYLAPGEISFDLVIMDEASQIKPQDALGSIARGTQLVVVGDPKQLPPTSFFDRVVDDDEPDPTTLEESESILDATLPMFPVRRLRWHYRSQHESLIAFSNQSFYDSDLVLFPSPHKDADEYGIKYTRVPRGCFVNRRNMEEARVISEAVREHFRYHREETLGVVAMSAEQRLQIEQAIETLAKSDTLFQAQLEKDAARRESLFVKNLENVQGDERDVIFISMTYGPREPGGRVLQRFGPINSDVGWRRLNVLLTRSRKRMHIYSSMGSNDIVVDATSRRGVKALRDFLNFCENGVLYESEGNTGRAPDSDFEIAVMNALRDEGFECVPQVGVAGFFIDLAVVDPGNPGRYLMGIECDGATYHSAKSARDRDRLRQNILERLGWNIRRIWSTDWFKNPQGELRPIIRELHELKTPVGPADRRVPEVAEKEPIEEKMDLEVRIDSLVPDEMSLRDRLIMLDEEVIRKECPDTPESRRLLRPAMIEALLEYMPTSKVEFLEMIPSYIRLATEAAEGRYLEQVFEIINSSLE